MPDGDARFRGSRQMAPGSDSAAGSERETQRRQTFALVVPVSSAEFLLGTGGSFVLAATRTNTRATRPATGRWWIAVVQARSHMQRHGWAGLFVLGVASWTWAAPGCNSPAVAGSTVGMLHDQPCDLRQDIAAERGQQGTL
jgi:hypothetical protein